MSLNRSDKERIVGELNEKFKEASSVFVTDYRGLKVDQMEELRRLLRKESIEYIVVKNTLLRLA
ncbi:MAG: 50S ribosomal protein L10, partial [Thermodesulfobacteriota bacterium]